jgi:hypothetical protein
MSLTQNLCLFFYILNTLCCNIKLRGCSSIISVSINIYFTKNPKMQVPVSPTTSYELVPPIDKNESKKLQNKDISWSSVNFTVKGKTILSNAWGDVKQGEVCAVMGPSGSGKSSVLNVLAGRSSSGGDTLISGEVFMCSTVINENCFLSLSRQCLFMHSLPSPPLLVAWTNISFVCNFRSKLEAKRSIPYPTDETLHM